MTISGGYKKQDFAKWLKIKNLQSLVRAPGGNRRAERVWNGLNEFDREIVTLYIDNQFIIAILEPFSILGQDHE